MTIFKHIGSTLSRKKVSQSNDVFGNYGSDNAGIVCHQHNVMIPNQRNTYQDLPSSRPEGRAVKLNTFADNW